MRVDLDQDTLGRVNVNLKPTGLVERRVEERQEALETQEDGVMMVQPSSSHIDLPLQAARLTWCVMSGRASAMSLPVLAKIPWWSSQLRSAYLASLPPFPSLPPDPALIR